MLIILGAIFVAAVVAVVPVLALLRRHRADARARPDWWSEWRRTDRATKRRVRAALRNGETLYDPREARLLIGLAAWLDRVQSRSRFNGWPHYALAAVVVVGAVATGHLAATVQLAPLLLIGWLRHVALPGQRRRRELAVARHRHLLGE